MFINVMRKPENAMRPHGVSWDHCYETLWTHTPCFLIFILFFSIVSSQQQEHIATRIHCPRFSVERINSYELILYNGHKTIRCSRQKVLRQKINFSQIKVCRFQWTLSFRKITLAFANWITDKNMICISSVFLTFTFIKKYK